MSGRRITLIIGVVILVGLSGALWVQQRQIERLRADNATLREAAAAAESLRDEIDRLKRERVDPSELDRLRGQHAELVRLRGEVAQLRRQLAESGAKPADKTPTPQPTLPVQTLVANTLAKVPLTHTLVTGGWMTPAGKRALILMRPEMQGDQVALQTRIVELSDQTLTKVGLDALRSAGTEAAAQSILGPEQADALLQTLDDAEDVDVLATPRIVTANGVQARMKMTESKTTATGDRYELGPSIDVTPQVSLDGTSVDLNISAQLRLPRN